MKLKELREKSKSELTKLVSSQKEELFRLRLKLKTGQLDKTHRISEIRSDLARTLTLLNEGKK